MVTGCTAACLSAACYAAAFVENDPRRVVEAGLACIPPRSSYALLIRDLLDWSARFPDDWRKVWQMVEDKWDKDDPCPDGAWQTSTSTPSSTVPTSPSDCCSARATGSRRWKSPLAVARTPTATRRAPRGCWA